MRRATLYVLLLAGVLVALVACGEDKRAATALSAFQQHLSAGDYAAAQKDLDGVADLGGRNDVQTAKKQLQQATGYQKAVSLLDSKQYAAAIDALAPLGNYKDASDRLNDARYGAAQDAIRNKQWQQAADLLKPLPPGYKDAKAIMAQVSDALSAQLYKDAMTAKDKGDLGGAIMLLQQAKSAGGKVPDDIEAQISAISDQAKAKAERDLIEGIKANMKHFTEGPVGIAVSQVELRHAVGQHVATGKGTFILVDAGVLNRSLDSEHANPNNFTLSTPDGYTAPPDTETYGLTNYLDATNLNKGQQSGGWLVFYLPKSATYTLNYRSFGAKTSLQIAPSE